MSDINRCESFFLQPVSEDEIGNLKNNLNIHKQARSQIFWRGGGKHQRSLNVCLLNAASIAVVVEQEVNVAIIMIEFLYLQFTPL